VPHGDCSAAQEARRRTQEAGLEVSSYGSYYKVLDSDGAEMDFTPVLESALALGTDTVRIWSGARPSETAGPGYRQKFMDILRSNLDTAEKLGVRLALEFHVNSLSDSNAAAQALLAEVNHANLYTYWQPMYWVADAEYRLQGLMRLRERIINLHVFHWMFYPMKGRWSESRDRRPLTEGAVEWKQFLSVPLSPGAHFALLEFVREDDPEQFLRDAEALRSWLTGPELSVEAQTLFQSAREQGDSQ
jgi:3-dehydroshikimate dehydratase